MFAVLVALLSLTETCPLEYRPNDWGPAVYAECESPGAQAAADAALVGLSLPDPFRGEGARPAELNVVEDQGVWRATPLIVAMDGPRVPMRALTSGVRSGRCVYAGRIDDRRRLDDIEIVCDIDDVDDELDRFHYDLRNMLNRALRSARVAGAVGDCLSSDMDWIFHGEPLDEANIDLPEPSALCP